MSSFTINEKKYLNVVLILSGWAWSLYSLYVGVSIPDYPFFSRSGSVLVLFAVIVEYRQFPLRQERLEKGVGLASGGTRYHELSNTFKVAGFAAHTSIVLGTFIWGYGDILIGLLCEA